MGAPQVGPTKHQTAYAAEWWSGGGIFGWQVPVQGEGLLQVEVGDDVATYEHKVLFDGPHGV